MDKGPRLYRFVSGALPEARHDSDAAFLAHWRNLSHVQGEDAGAWRRKMVPILKDATAAAQATTIDPSTAESFCLSLVAAGVIEVDPGYDVPL